jgi:hypothetical protein
VVENGGGACKNPLRLARGIRFLAWFRWLRQGEMYPAGRRCPHCYKAEVEISVPTPGDAVHNGPLRENICRISGGKIHWMLGSFLTPPEFFHMREGLILHAQSRQSAKLFSSRWNWDSPTPFPQPSLPPPP